MTGYFVTGTDTNVGKTVLSALLVAALRRDLLEAGADRARSKAPDRDSVRRWTEAEEERLPPERYRFDPPVSPHLAAREAGVRIRLDNFEFPAGADRPQMGRRGRWRRPGAAERARPDVLTSCGKSDSR